MSQQQTRTAIYCRLSRDDGDGESMSIATQKQMLRQYARDHSWTVEQEYADDGYSGTNFNRPDFLRMKADIQAQRFDILLTKDLSRLGRDYLETGLLIDSFFVDNRVRYIAVNDGVDTAKSENEIMPFKNILNESFP